MTNIDPSILISALESQLAQQAASGAVSYSIGNRSVTKESIEKQIAALKELQFMQERQTSGVFRKAAIRRPSP